MSTHKHRMIVFSDDDLGVQLAVGKDAPPGYLVVYGQKITVYKRDIPLILKACEDAMEYINNETTTS